MTNKKKLIIAKFKHKIVDAVKKNQVVIVVGQTGCGKSTQVIQYLHDNKENIGLKHKDIIACLHPRSIAAVNLAERVAYETKTKLGSLVGYQIRFYSECNKNTKIMYMTVGFMARILSNRRSDYGVIIIDEAHERSVETDIVLGLMKKRMEKDKQVRLVVMSATLNVEEIESFFPQAVTVWVDRAPDQVDVVYRPIKSQDYVAEIVSFVLQLGDQSGHMLIFLPSEEKVHRCAGALKNATMNFKLKGAIVLKFYSTMNKREKMKVFREFNGRRKIIVATNVAETSLTIEGVDVVIDSGYVHRVSYDHESRVERWRLLRVSAAEAEQRKGRTGRTGRGTCYRMYEKFDIDATKDLRASLQHIAFVANQNEELQEMLVSEIQSGYSLSQLRVIHRICCSMKSSPEIKSQRNLLEEIAKLFTKNGERSTLFALEEEGLQQLTKVMSMVGYFVGKERKKLKPFVDEMSQRFSAAQLHCVMECKEPHFKKVKGEEDLMEKLGKMLQGKGLGDDYSTEREFSMYPTPEIKLTNLGSLVLRMKSMGVHDVTTFPFIVPPVKRDLDLATQHLHELDLLKDDGRLTDLGRRVSMLPLSPALGKVAVLGQGTNSRRHILAIVAMLSVRCLFQSSRGAFDNPNGDLFKLLYAYDQAWEMYFDEWWMKDQGIHYSNLMYADLIMKQLDLSLPVLYQPLEDEVYNIKEITSVFLSGFFQNLSFRTKKNGVYTLVNGKECQIQESSCVARAGIIMAIVLQTADKSNLIKMRNCTLVSEDILRNMDLRYYHIRPNLWSQVLKKLSTHSSSVEFNEEDTEYA